MKLPTYALILAAAASGYAMAATTAYTNPVGYVSQPCAANSDTIVGVPLRSAPVAAGALSVDPDIATTPGSAILTIAGTPGFTPSAFAAVDYVKFNSGAGAGQWFTVTANDATTITVNLNGGTIAAAAADTLEVIPFWTLASLIDPSTATTDPLTTTNAIVASTSTLAAGRRTQILIPDFVSAGTNLSPAVTYYIHGGIWKKNGDNNVSHNADQLWPDTYFIIRNPVAVTSGTTYTVSGSVEPYAINVPLLTQAAIAQDNFNALPRPIDTTLNALGLGGTSAFMASTSTLAAGRRDQLLVFPNATAALNKSPSATYYYNAGTWKLHGGGSTDYGTATIPAGAGFIIRKYQSGTGATATWTNPPSY